MTVPTPDVPSGEFALALREAIQSRGLPLDRVRAHLLDHGHDVSVATLSYWQTGRSVPLRKSSVAAIGALEVVLNVPRGSLASQLPAARAARGADTQDPHVEMAAFFPGAGLADRFIAELGLTWEGGFNRIEGFDIITLGPDRQVATHVIEDVIVARRAGVDRVVSVYLADEPGSLIHVTARANCRVGRVLEDRPSGLTVAELVLDQPLLTGAPHRFSHSLTFDGPPGQPANSWYRVYLTPRRLAGLEVRFAPGDLPTSVKAYAGPAERPRMKLKPWNGPRDLVTLTEQDFGPGGIALSWGWDGAEAPDEV